MHIECTGPIETIWHHVDDFVTFEQWSENMNYNPQSC